MEYKTKIAVLGADGQLGSEFKFLSGQFEHLDFIFFSRKALDVTSEPALRSMILSDTPDYVINCAAYTAVDKAETDRQSCFAINTHACRTITEILNDTNTRLIHFSSDYVYHTFDGFPIRESNETDPKGIYAKSKLEGENIIRQSGVEALIIRTSWVVSSFGHNFLKTMLKLAAEKSSINVINDQYGAPTYARHLAKAILEIIVKVKEKPALVSYFDETYNYSNEGIITWYDLATHIMKVTGLTCEVCPIDTSNYRTAAVRPHWSVLSKQKIKETFEVEIPHWYSAIQECLNEINREE
ncbi:MAG: dTDP-4-dehydrorhamnose reductase [Saprospiraceae bacterium]|nr:dTDP-4-dehydrorhamnose reductase [Saprospiraceae bacterium]